MTKLMSASQAVDRIQDGATLLTVGFTMMGASESVLKEIERRFLETGHPCGLTLMHCAGQSDREHGIERLAHPGLLSRIIGSHWGLAPRIGQLINDNAVAGHCLPQGQMTHLVRAMASGKPGSFSRVGLGTFIDPRIEGGMMNDKARAEGSLVRLIILDGEEYLFYRAVPLHVVLIRGTTADGSGNLTTEEEAVKLEVLSAAQAGRSRGATVIAQVKHVVADGTLRARDVIVPGICIDAVVVARDAESEHRQTACAFVDRSFTGEIRVPAGRLEAPPLDARTVIGRRGAMELFPGAVVNLGTGIPGDTIGPVAAQEGVLDRITLTIESGVIGGVPCGGADFGIARSPTAIIEHPQQFDYYNGTGVDLTYMGVAEVDREGNVNVSRIGTRAIGCGGFIDITQPARKVVFLTTFTAGDLEVRIADGRLSIVREGRHRKFINAVRQVTFSGRLARTRRQPVLFVTERAVFRLTRDGLELIEIAPGVDLDVHILSQMDFTPHVSSDLREMPACLFGEGPVGLWRSEEFSETSEQDSASSALEPAPGGNA